MRFGITAEVLVVSKENHDDSVALDGLYLTWYLVTGIPPSMVGATQEASISRARAKSTRPVGASGFVYGVTGGTSDHRPGLWLETARIRNLYAVPFSRPDTRVFRGAVARTSIGVSGQASPDSAYSTWYLVMSEPPSDTGLVQLTSTLLGAILVVGETTRPGAVTGMYNEDMSDQRERPAWFLAAAQKR